MITLITYWNGINFLSISCCTKERDEKENLPRRTMMRLEGVERSLWRQLSEVRANTSIIIMDDDNFDHKSTDRQTEGFIGRFGTIEIFGIEMKR